MSQYVSLGQFLMLNSKSASNFGPRDTQGHHFENFSKIYIFYGLKLDYIWPTFGLQGLRPTLGDGSIRSNTWVFCSPKIFFLKKDSNHVPRVDFDENSDFLTKNSIQTLFWPFLSKTQKFEKNYFYEKVRKSGFREGSKPISTLSILKASILIRQLRKSAFRNGTNCLQRSRIARDRASSK